MKKGIITIGFLAITICCIAQEKSQTLTDSLATRFNIAWNNEDIPEMTSLMDSSVIFKSPFQFRNGITEVANTVLKTNPPHFKISSWTELDSHVGDNLAWSIGNFMLDIFENGKFVRKTKNKGDFIYVFRKEKNEWKLVMMIFHEDSPAQE